MAYATKYQIDFLNNDENNFSIYLLLKDYTGSISQLTGGPDPFVLSYTSGDDQIINPIRASEAEINFYNDGATPLTEFYSEDDEAWRIDFYFNDPAGAKLLWSGFVVQDSCQETFQDPPHIVILKATDNLALLKDVPFDEAWQAETIDTSNYLIYRQNAITGGDANDGIITLGIDFISSLRPPDDFQTGSSPYKDLVGWGGAPLNNDRWIIKNGLTAKTFHVSGTISVMMTGFSDPVRWLLQKSDDTTTVIAFQNCIVNIRYDLQIDIDITLQPGQRLFALQASDGNNDNDKIYYETEWMISDVSSKQTSILDKLSLFDYIKYSLIKTGLSLPLNIYSNIYENSMGDREDDLGNDMFAQTHLFSGMFLSDDGEWANCYEILEKILFPLNATLQQANGAWQIVRWPELRINTSNAIRGTAYDATLDFTSRTAVTLAPNAPVAIRSNTVFINADAKRSILRPYKNVKFTFNYEQPKSLINGVDLKITGALDHSDPVGDFRYDYYEIPSFWKHIDGDTSLIVVATDTITNTEIERYIYTPKFGAQFRFLRFNSIEVTAGDVFDFICSFRHAVLTSLDDAFSIRFLLVTPDNNYYLMRGYIGSGTDYQPLAWAGPFSLPISFDDVTSIFIAGNTDDSDWAAYSLTRIQQNANLQFTLPKIPEDSVLLIDIAGGNGPQPDYTSVAMLTKEMRLEFLFRINKSTSITGQRHLNKIADNPKNKLEQDIEIDDSPRNPIAGALFTASLTNFGEDIGEIYFTKTKSWHRSGITETRRLGEITTMEREQMQSVSRTIIEGSIDYTNLLISIMNVLQIDTLPNLNFIFGVTEINFMEGMFKATLWEIHAGEVDAEMAYLFSYIYKTS